MNQTKIKLQDLGFNKNHAYLMFAAGAVFLLLVVPRSNIKLSAMFSKADNSQQQMLTYEDVKIQVYADAGIIDEQQYQTNLENQFALLDRGQADGKVLGATIGLDDVPSADQLFSQDQLDLIPIKSTIPTTETSVQDYADRILRIESYYDTTELFANLNSSDKNLLDKTSQQVQGILDSMSQIPVPSELVAYHKYNVMYYQTISKLGQSFSSDDGNLAKYSKDMFSLMDKLASLKTEIESKYQISL